MIADISTGAILGNHRILAELTRTSPLPARLAERTDTLERVVLKLAPLDDAVAMARLERETRAFRAASGEGLVPWCGYATWPEQGWAHVATGVWGPSLVHILECERTGRLPAPLALAFGERVARALAALHARGYAHGDVKPGNLLLDGSGKVALADLECARPVDGPPEPGGALMGTVPFIAPELFLGGSEQMGTASDVWGLGVVLWLALTGEYPFGHDPVGAVAAAVAANRRAAWPPEIPEEARSLVEILLEPDPTSRPKAARWAAMAAATLGANLPRVLAGLATRVRATPAFAELGAGGLVVNDRMLPPVPRDDAGDDRARAAGEGRPSADAPSAPPRAGSAPGVGPAEPPAKAAPSPWVPPLRAPESEPDPATTTPRTDPSVAEGKARRKQVDLDAPDELLAPGTAPSAAFPPPPAPAAPAPSESPTPLAPSPPANTWTRSAPREISTSRVASAPTTVESADVAPTVAPGVTADGAARDRAPESDALLRRAAARWFSRMNPARNFALTVVVSGRQIELRPAKGMLVAIGTTEFAVDPSDPWVEVEPAFAGCLIVPSVMALDVSSASTVARFWITPLAEGALPDACVRIRHRGKVVETLATPTAVVARTWSHVCLALSIASPALMQVLEGLGWTPAVEVAAGFPMIGGLWRSLGPSASVLVLFAVLAATGLVLKRLTRPLAASSEPELFPAVC